MTTLTEPVRAVAYIRVSVDRDNLTSPELQLFAIQEHCNRSGYEIVEILRDIDLSGRFWNTRQVERAVAMIEFDAAEVLVVARWSRVARNRLDWAVAVDRIESVGGRLESAIEPVDERTPAGRFTRGMLAELAAFEADRASEIWQETKRRRRSLGLIGDGNERFGYVKIDGRLRPDPVTGPALAQMFRRYNRGENFSAIARWLNTEGHPPAACPGRESAGPGGWRPGPVRLVMIRGFAAGFIYHKGQLLPGEHPPVISQRIWATFLREYGVRHKPRHRRSSDPDTFPFLTLLECGCGKQLTALETDYGPSYRCHYHFPARNRLGDAKAVAVTGNIVEKRIRGWLGTLATDPAVGAAARAASVELAERNLRHARDLTRQIGAAAPAETAAVGDLRKAWAVAVTQSRSVDPVTLAAAVLDDWEQLDPLMKRRYLSDLIDRIVVLPRGVPERLEVRERWATPGPLGGDEADARALGWRSSAVPDSAQCKTPAHPATA